MLRTHAPPVRLDDTASLGTVLTNRRPRPPRRQGAGRRLTAETRGMTRPYRSRRRPVRGFLSRIGSVPPVRRSKLIQETGPFVRLWLRSHLTLDLLQQFDDSLERQCGALR